MIRPGLLKILKDNLTLPEIVESFEGRLLELHKLVEEINQVAIDNLRARMFEGFHLHYQLLSSAAVFADIPCELDLKSKLDGLIESVNCLVKDLSVKISYGYKVDGG